jgi:hypothetical protein
LLVLSNGVKPANRASTSKRGTNIALLTSDHHGSPDGFVGDSVIVSDSPQGFLILHDATEHRWPFFSRNPIAGFCGTWMAFGEWQHRSITCTSLIVLKKLLEFLKEQTRGGMKVEKHW